VSVHRQIKIAKGLATRQKVGDRQGSFEKQDMMFEHPVRQHRFRRLLELLIDQYGDFTAQIRGVV
jgi:hypothetical protein